MISKNNSLPQPLLLPLRSRPAMVWTAVLVVALSTGCDRDGKAAGADPGHGGEKQTAAARSERGQNAAAKAEDHGKAEAHADEVKLTEEAVRRYGINLQKASKRPLLPTIIAPARVSFNLEQTSHVSVPVTGRVVDLKVRLGDTVKKGDVLMVVDSPDLGQAQSDYLQQTTALSVARPAVELAQSAYERAQTLLKESQGISLTEVQKRQSELQAAKGALKTAEGAVTAAANKLHLLGMSQQAVDALAQSKEISPKYEVRAPIGGQVVEKEVTLGELVRPDKESLLVLADLSTLWVIADVPQSNLQDVKVGNRARVILGFGAGATPEGKVSYIAPQIDPSTRSAQVRIDMKSEGTGLQGGMFAQAEIDATPSGQQPESVLAVPEEAVQTVEGGPAVFVPVAGEPNTFAKRAVKVGPAVGGWVPVHSGLKEGDDFVAAGSFVLKADLGKSGAEHED